MSTASTAQAQGAEQLATPRSRDEENPSAGRWYQILASNYVGARLSSVTYDPDDPKRLFVGTEQGLVLRSTDGGITWDELEVRPTVIRTRRDLGPPPLQFNFAEDTDLVHYIREPYRPSTVYIALFEGMPLVAPNANMRGDDPAGNLLLTYVLPETDDPDPTQLHDSLIDQETEPIERLAVCRGAYYPLLAASPLEIFGSNDDGITWIPILRLPSTGRIQQIACHPSRPEDIFVTTDLGIYYSRDGGRTLDQDTSGFPPGESNAIHIGNDGKVLVGISDMLFVGSPEEGFEYVYPRFADSHTAPWADIQWVTRAGPEIWIGTEDGLRVSRDNGATWENVAPTRFSRHFISQVVLTPLPNGRSRVSVLARICPPWVHEALGRGCQTTEIMTSTDGGESWTPFFLGMTQRSVQFMTHVPASGLDDERWLVVTGGELWASRTVGTTVFAPETRSWAGERQRRTLPLEVTLDRGLREMRLDPDSYERVFDRSRRQAWLPQVQVLFQWTAPRAIGDLALEPIPLFADAVAGRADWGIQMFFAWSLRDAVRSYVETDESRELIIWQRYRIGWVIEDAWHERQMLLQRLSRGAENLLQAEVLKARIEGLETILSFYLGELFDEEGER